MVRNANTPANTTSLKKCAPAAMRSTPTAAPNVTAAATAAARQGGGSRNAGAMVQNAPDGSPATNEQFFAQSPRGSHQARKCSLPPNSATSIGRGRPQCSFRIRLAMTPGASARVTIISTIARPGISSGRRGRTSLTASATKAGSATSAITQVTASRRRR